MVPHLITALTGPINEIDPATIEIGEPVRVTRLGKDLVVLYEAVQQFVVAEDETGRLIGCGALALSQLDLARALQQLHQQEQRTAGLALEAGEIGAERLGAGAGTARAGIPARFAPT